MHLPDLLGPDIVRAFPDRIASLPDRLLVGDDAARRFALALRQSSSGSDAVMLFDQRTYQAAGPMCEAGLRDAGFRVDTLLIEDDASRGTPTCDDLTHDVLAARLPRADVLVAVGSGVVNDLTKWLAFDRATPYGVFATAASMNGYAAANVAATLRGVKTLVRARAPRVVAADARVLASAPSKLTASGFGDLIAKPVSTADWLMNHMLFEERYERELVALVDRLEPRYLDRPEALAEGEASAVQALFEALVLSGCTMTLHGSSLPASGGEHLISHTLDMMTEVDGVPHDLHGRQVGVATIIAAALWQRVLALAAPTFDPTVRPFDAAMWGPAASSVQQEARAKESRTGEACTRLSSPGVWPALCRAIRPSLRDPSVLRDQLRRAGAAWRLSDIGCSRERFLQALARCGSMRARFTSIDLAHVTGVLPRAAAEVVDEWLH